MIIYQHTFSIQTLNIPIVKLSTPDATSFFQF